jgi:hypothetical protein
MSLLPPPFLPRIKKDKSPPCSSFLFFLVLMSNQREKILVPPEYLVQGAFKLLVRKTCGGDWVECPVCFKEYKDMKHGSKHIARSLERKPPFCYKVEPRPSRGTWTLVPVKRPRPEEQDPAPEPETKRPRFAHPHKTRTSDPEPEPFYKRCIIIVDQTLHGIQTQVKTTFDERLAWLKRRRADLESQGVDPLEQERTEAARKELESVTQALAVLMGRVDMLRKSLVDAEVKQRDDDAELSKQIPKDSLELTYEERLRIAEIRLQRNQLMDRYMEQRYKTQSELEQLVQVQAEMEGKIATLRASIKEPANQKQIKAVDEQTVATRELFARFQRAVNDGWQAFNQTFRDEDGEGEDEEADKMDIQEEFEVDVGDEK